MHIEGNTLVMREPKTFHFNFDMLKNVGKNLDHEIEFIIKCNKSEHEIKSKTEPLLYKYNHSNTIHELKKQ